VRGWRGRIGLLYPSTGRREFEFPSLLPEGLSTHVSRVPSETALEPTALARMGTVENLEGAARLLTPVGLDSLCWACSCTRRLTKGD
jgi:maleate cis-trans isomerase